MGKSSYQVTMREFWHNVGEHEREERVLVAVSERRSPSAPGMLRVVIEVFDPLDPDRVTPLVWCQFLHPEARADTLAPVLMRYLWELMQAYDREAWQWGKYRRNRALMKG